MEEVTIGDCRLILSDCCEVLPMLPKVDAIISDPPYGGGYAANPIVGKGKSQSNHESMSWDDAAIIGIEDIISAGNVAVIWGGNYYCLPPSRGWLTWFKPDAPPSMAQFEMAWTNLDKNARQISWSIAATNAERVGHATQKPIFVMIRSIEFAGNPQTVCDTFMGSGTTGVACVNLGRKFIGIERERKYWEIAVERIKQAYAQPRLFEDAKPAPQQQTML